MAVTSFAIDDVISGLVTALQAATGFRAPTESGTDVPVYDGPVYGDGSNFSFVCIGADGSDNPQQRPGRFTSPWHDFDLTLDEEGVIQCAVVVWAGDANPATASDQRGTAVGILQDVDEALRASNTAMALGVATLLWSKIDAGEIFQEVNENGTETRITFTYSYRANLQVT